MIKIAPVFSDRMVLQKGKNISVFGTGDNGERVCVSFGNSSAQTVVSDGKWLVKLPAVNEYADGLEMTVSCGGYNRKFTDIAVGEVWLAGGQSNMEYELQNCTTGKQHLENDKPNVRFYYTPKINSLEPDYEAVVTNTGWSRFEGESPKAWSAVGYIFAKELSEKLGCTVGIIGCNWGGTKACHWMSEESLQSDRDMRFDYDKYIALIEGKSEEQLTEEYREYERYSNEWERKKGEYYANTPDPSWDECIRLCGECKYPGPPLPLNPMSPGALYRSMIKLVCPYTLAGFLYYQGESDDDNPGAYYKMLRGLIDLWRSDWDEAELPFMIVQLPMHRYSGDEDRKNWCIIREAQDKIFRTVKNTGLAVCIDCGEFNEIHPHDKENVAHRLCLQALYNVYGDKNDEYNAPMFGSCIIKDGEIEVTVRTSTPLVQRIKDSGFEIAGADGEFRHAVCAVSGNKLSVSSSEVPEPLHVRYLWTNYSADIPIYNEAGLPLAPFRA